MEATMLASGKLVGFIPTKDYDAARAFYEGKLGFQFISLDQFALVVSVGGHKIRITKIPNFAPLEGTILGWGGGRYSGDRHLASRPRGSAGKVSVRTRQRARNLDRSIG